jgi:glycerol uptake facilitator-like aquaporin
MQLMTIVRRAVAEFIGTAFLLAAIVRSGIMGERLSSGNAAIALLANRIATGAALVVLILTFGPISGAHFNPAVTVVAVFQRRMPWRDAPSYVFMQIAGGFSGVASANVMFGFPAVSPSARARDGWPQVFSECIATLGLIIVIAAGVEFRESAAPYAVAAYIASAYWFTSSTSFANPAVTMARAATDTFTGIRPGSVPAFIIAQIAGVAIAVPLWNWLREPASIAVDETKSMRKAAK